MGFRVDVGGPAVTKSCAGKEEPERTLLLLLLL